MASYKYSIIIPHKNNPVLLKRCVDSIPDRSDVQVIIIDDQSDTSIVNFDNIHFSRNVEIYKSDKSGGGGYARNLGLSKANGDWILFADCDDYFSLGFLDVLDQYTDKDFEVVFFDFNFVDSKSMKELHSSYIDRRRYLIENFDGSNKNEDFIRFRIYTVWSKMVRKDFLNKYNIRFEEIFNGNDIFFSLMVGFYVEKFRVIPDKLYNYTFSSQSVSRKVGPTRQYYNFINTLKINNFYRFIDHNEWCDSLFRKILSPLKNDGILCFLRTVRLLLRDIKVIKKQGRKYVDFINNNQYQNATSTR